MSMTCEISGEPLGSIKAEDNIVVTPSGHICIKRLLLSKLAENGGMDPFEGGDSKNGLPLSEDQLVTLQRPSFASGSSTAAASSVPPRPQATSLPNLLGLVQQEYDALVLELFDTRKALEETRRELSQALYQNDAAIRVVARLSQERDQARHELEQWNASVGAGGNGAAEAVATATAGAAQNGMETEESKPPGAEDNANNVEPTPKRRRLEPLDPDAPSLQNVIPPSILDDMDETWAKLNADRKPMIKAMAAEAPTPETLAEYQDVDQKAWHKSTCKGVPCMAKSGDLIVTAGKDKQLVVYHEVEEVVKQTLSFGSVATCVDIGPIMVAAGDGKGKITAYAQDEDGTYDTVTTTIKVNSAVVDVQVHPTQRYVVAATADGDVLIFALVNEEESRLQLVSSFKNDTDDGTTDFTCGALHPDGLMYVAGTKQGSLIIWDFKNQQLAAMLKDDGMEEADPVTSISISNNGYNIAASHASSVVRVWDLRKQKVVTVLKDMLKTVDVVAFEKSGKYLAMGGQGGMKITTIKEWGTTASYETNKPVSGLVWSKAGLEVCSDKERSIHFFASPAK